MASRKVLLSGVKPTGRPHIGNYFGAMRQFVDLQGTYDESYIFIANYHAMNFVHDAERLRSLAMGVAMDYLAIGLDPDKTAIFLQSDVPEVTELSWIFSTITSFAHLSRAHAFKDAQAKEKDVNAGTFSYPLLMAADILMYGADVVPVGKDQKQHLEITRDIAAKFNRTFGDTFSSPEPLILDEVQTVPGIDGRKMSKSYNNTIPLFGSEEEVRRAVMSIVTDSKNENEPKDPENCNVFALHRILSPDDLPNIEKRYREGTIGYKESKEILLRNAESLIAPLRKRREEIAKNEDEVKRILSEGAARAREKARKKMDEVRRKTGLLLGPEINNNTKS